MAQISLQSDIVYGPVLSRRLGRSFGINLLPQNHKSCSFDCVYCQYGRTNNKALSPDKQELPTVEQVLEAVERALRKLRSLDCLTFSGNGEPTIHPNFSEIVQGVKAIRDHIRPNIKLALLSNASTVMKPRVFQSLELIDFPIMKLDAGEELTFTALNRPIDTIKLQDIIKGLKKIDGLIIQSVLVDGQIYNVRGAPYHSWIDKLLEIQPTQIQIYSTERPTAKKSVVRVSSRKLQLIESSLINQYDLNVRAFWFDSR